MATPEAIPTAISWPLNRPNQRGPWSQETFHANGHANTAMPLPGWPPVFQQVDSSNLPGGPKSLAGISIRAALLGSTFGAALLGTILLAAQSNPLWRATFFLSIVSLFHFLEYYITARYNTPVADIAAFLLSQNGWAYDTANTVAFLECLLTQHFFGHVHFVSRALRYFLLALGFAMLVVGQVSRSTAMAQAGTNFNHTVQDQKKMGHELVTSGLYAWLRHPSYFGFWWWALGTQMVLGNTVCLVGDAVILWRFFSKRIASKSLSEQYSVLFLDWKEIEWMLTYRPNRGRRVTHQVLWK